MEPSAEEKAVIKKQFINALSFIMASLDRSTTERDIRKAYREEKGHNINIMLDKVGSDSLYNFLRIHCKAICNVFRNDDEGVHIVRISNEISTHRDLLTKAKKKKIAAPGKAPKLNFHHTGVITENTFPRLNPQGSNKSKPVNTQQTSRPASQLSSFKSASTSNASKDDDDDEQRYMYQRCAQVEDVEPKDAKLVELKDPPKVHNPFDFPMLPSQENEQHEGDEHQSEEEIEDEFEDLEGSDQEVESFEASLGQMIVGADNEDRVLRPFRLDSPIYRIDYPEIVQDCSFRIPERKLMTFDYRLLFEIRMVVVFSPSQFFFQHGEKTIGALMTELNQFYDDIIPEDDLVINVFNIKPGLIVAAKVFHSWHRAQVLTAPDEDDSLTVLLLDSGNQIAVNVSNIRYLLKVFTVEPSNAVRGSLFGICPKDKAREWSPLVRQEFFEKVANKKLFAIIKSYFEEDDVYELEVNETVNGMISLNEQMVLSELADGEASEARA